ncbi:MAG: hypothetical protein HYV97_19395 [Bdellovibrio sp.]|nr:hypothetical protein [Bdellovibrio sp.]
MPKSQERSDSLFESMQDAFKAYDKDYKKICAIEKDSTPVPVLPAPAAPSLAASDSSHEVVSFDAQGRRSCRLQ